MGANEHLKEAVKTVKTNLKAYNEKHQTNIQLPTGKKADRPYPQNYRPELDTTDELDDEQAHMHMSYIGILRWAVELTRFDIAVEVSKLSSYLVNPRQGHMDAVHNIFGYIAKHHRSFLHFDTKEIFIDTALFEKKTWEDFYGDMEEELPPRMPEPLGNPVSFTAFVDADHAGNRVTRRSQSGYFLFIQNTVVDWYTKKQNTVESSAFGSEFVAARIMTEKVKELRYKLRMFGVPIDGYCAVYCDNAGVVNNCKNPESTLNRKHQQINCHIVRENVAMDVCRFGWIDSESNYADVLSKTTISADKRKDIYSQLLYI